MALSGEKTRSELQPRGISFWWYALIFLVSAGVSLFHLASLKGYPPQALLIGDPESYDLWARAIASGDWVGDGVFYQAPLYPYLLGAFYALFGYSPFATRLLQTMLLASASVLAAASGRRFFSARAGILAGFLTALYPMNLFFSAILQKTTLTFFLFSLFVYTLARIQNRATWKGWLASGTVLALLTLTRENALLFAPLLLIWLTALFFTRARKSVLGWLAAFICGLFLVFLPVAFRNLAVGGQFLLTTSQFGANFYYGNHQGATGIYKPLKWGRADWKYERDDARDLAEKAMGRPLTSGEVSRFWTGETLKEIARDPGAWVRLMGLKLLLFVNATEIGDTQDAYTVAHWSLPLGILLALFHFGVLFPLGVFGAAASWDRRREIWILYALAAAYVAAVVLFFIFDRYRPPLTLILGLFAAAGIMRLPGLLKKGGRKKFALCLILLMAAAAIANLPLLKKNVLSANAFMNLGFIEKDPGRAEQFFRLSLEKNPHHAKSRYGLALLLDRQGDWKGAVRELYAVIDVNERYTRAHLALARIMEREGQLEAAVVHSLAALRQAPEDPEPYAIIGRTVARTRDPDRVIELLPQVFLSEPTLPLVRERLVLVLARAMAGGPPSGEEGSAP